MCAHVHNKNLSSDGSPDINPVYPLSYQTSPHLNAILLHTQPVQYVPHLCTPQTYFPPRSVNGNSVHLLFLLRNYGVILICSSSSLPTFNQSTVQHILPFKYLWNLTTSLHFQTQCHSTTHRYLLQGLLKQLPLPVWHPSKLISEHLVKRRGCMH